MTINRTVCGLLAACFVSAGAYGEEEADFRSLLSEHTYSIKLDGGRLDGPGAALIMELAANSQFVALGEEHYNYHIPAITTALFADLQQHHDYRYFMVEQDPVTMELFSAAPLRGNFGGMAEFLRSYPLAVTFNSDQELQTLADIGRMSTAENNPIWGCDQASGVTHILDQLLLEVDDPSSIEAIESLRQQSARAEAVRDLDKSFYIFDTDTAVFEQLQSDVKVIPGSRAEWLIDVLVQANRIFGYYKNGEAGLLPGYYENNRFREEHLKDLCLSQYRAAASEQPMPKAMMKFGSWHMYQGLSPTRLHTIGDFFAGIARFNDTGFLSIHFSSRPTVPQESMNATGFVWPFIEDLDESEFAVIDLRPFRRYPNRSLVQKSQGDEWNKAYREDFIRLVYGYDLVFYVGITKDATFEQAAQ